MFLSTAYYRGLSKGGARIPDALIASLLRKSEPFCRVFDVSCDADVVKGVGGKCLVHLKVKRSLDIYRCTGCRLMLYIACQYTLLHITTGINGV